MDRVERSCVQYLFSSVQHLSGIPSFCQSGKAAGSQTYARGGRGTHRALEQIGRIDSNSAAVIRSSASKPGTRIPRST